MTETTSIPLVQNRETYVAWRMLRWPRSKKSFGITCLTRSES